MKSGDNEDSGPPEKQDEQRPQRDNLKAEEGPVWRQGSGSHVHCPSGPGKKGKQSQCWFLPQERELLKPEPGGNQLRTLGRA